MPKPWLKMWSSSLDSEKIQSLSGDQFKAWMNLLWIALRYDKDGELPPMPSIAFQGRLSLQGASEMIGEQIELGLVEKHRNSYRIHDWKHWQGDALSDAERQARRRAKSRDSHVTCHVTQVDEVTHESQSPARAETKTKTEREDKTKTKTAPDEPEWLPEPEWGEFKEMRRTHPKVKNPVTLTVAIRELTKFRADGLDVAAILRRSTMCGWAGVFPLGYTPNGSSGHSAPKLGKVSRQVQEGKAALARGDSLFKDDTFEEDLLAEKRSAKDAR